jgi:hypothetical protein
MPDNNNPDLGSRYNNGGSRLDPRGGQGQGNTGSGTSGGKNKYGDTKPYGGGKP